MIYDNASENTKPIRILRWPEVQSRVGFSKSYAYVLQSKGLFPKPIRLIEGGRAMGYIESSAAVSNRITPSINYLIITE
jgi:prophage regulatory protein